ncbi:MAG: FMN-binding protein [Deltaproteobacteria bacterium]|nr:FMN-binding protein [Deltaproteobacteria bacterium]
MSGPEPTSAKLVGTLTLAGLLSGLVLVGVFQATKPLIAANRAAAMQAAVTRVVPGAVQAASYERVGDKVQPSKVEVGAASDKPMAYAGLDKDGRVLGFAIPAEGPGFMDTIRLLYGYVPGKGTVIGMEVLDSRETPGLGDKIIKDADFVGNFKQLDSKPEIVGKKKGTKSKPNEIDFITGATISSKAVVKILNGSTAQWAQPLTTAAPPAGGKP